MTTEATLRLFVAIEVPPEILQEARHIQTLLQKRIQGPARWVRPEGIHLTIKFLGDVSPERRADIEGLLARQVRGTAPLSFQVSGPGAFPTIDRPRVIWLGIGGDTGPLEALQRRLEDAFASLGFAREERPFRPHLTLARVKIPKMLIGLADAIDREGPYRGGSFTAQSISLIASALTPQGAVYERLASFPLAGNNQ